MGKALASLVTQSLSKDRFEVIVVDNGSADPTADVVGEFRGSIRLRYLYEGVLGLSRARNKGWQSARGDYVAYLDDDAIAARDWLEKLIHRFHGPSVAPACVGGRVLPIWEAERPHWLSKELEGYLGMVDWGDRLTYLNDSTLYLSGSNIAYRRDVLSRMGGFTSRLGRKGNTLLSNDEILILWRLRRLGLGICYDPDIRVHHHVRPECLTKSWYRRRCFWQGASDAILESEFCRLSGESWRYLPRAARDTADLLFYVAKYVRAVGAKPGRRRAAACRARHWQGRVWADTLIALGRF